MWGDKKWKKKKDKKSINVKTSTKVEWSKYVKKSKKVKDKSIRLRGYQSVAWSVLMALSVSMQAAKATEAAPAVKAENFF